MQDAPLVLGIDLGTSGVRVAVINADRELLHTQAIGYAGGIHRPEDWLEACRSLLHSIPGPLRHCLRALAVDGTSGTLLACDQQGAPLTEALSYARAFPEHGQRIHDLVPQGGPASSSSGSVARALHLIDQLGPNLLLRHQADWINGWLLNDWRWGEEGNNLRLGWDLESNRWPAGIAAQEWAQALPEVRASGTVLGIIDAGRADELGLPHGLQVVAGTTDSNAAVLAADPGPDDGITVLGTTLVMKRFMAAPIRGAGVTVHRVGGQWLCGGASNAGGGVLRRFFSDDLLAELSRQIDPDRDSGLTLRPLPERGERFPVDDPDLQPVLEPRPVSDALYLHGLLEGLAEIEAKGWARLTELGADPPTRVVSLGGGARNPQWRRIRERRIGLPVVSCSQPPAAGVARLALLALQGGESRCFDLA